MERGIFLELFGEIFTCSRWSLENIHILRIWIFQFFYLPLPVCIKSILDSSTQISKISKFPWTPFPTSNINVIYEPSLKIVNIKGIEFKFFSIDVATFYWKTVKRSKWNLSISQIPNWNVKPFQPNSKVYWKA